MAEVYQSNFERVRRAVRQVLKEPADQDNVVQQLFVELIGNMEMRASFQNGDLGAWLSAIARHKAIDFGRRQSRLVPYDESSAEATRAHNDHSLQDFRQDLERFAQTQNTDNATLLRLRFVEGLTQTEASQAMNVPRSTLEDWERQLKADLKTFLLGPMKTRRAP